MALQDFLTLIAAKIQDTAGKLTGDRILEALQAAIDEYSTVMPRHKTQTITGDAVTVTFALATGFEENFSKVERIEYPVGRQEPEYLDETDYLLYRDPTTGLLKLRLTTMVLSVGATAYLAYTQRHHVQSGPPVGETVADTVPLKHRDAVATLAASHAAVMLAMVYAQSSDPTIGADSVDHGTKSTDYLALAKELRLSYGRRMGATDGIIAASATGDLDVDIQGGIDRFFHPRRER